MDVLLVPLRGGPEDALRGLCPAGGPGRGTRPGSEGTGLPKPEAQTRPGLQPLRLRPPVGAGALGTGKGGGGSPVRGPPEPEPEPVDPVCLWTPSAPGAAAEASRPGRWSAASALPTAATRSCPPPPAPPPPPPASGGAASRPAPPTGSRQAGPRSVPRPGTRALRPFAASDSASAAVLGHLWRRSPEAPEHLWAAGVKGRPRELLPDPPAHRDPALLPRSVWK